MEGEGEGEADSREFDRDGQLSCGCGCGCRRVCRRRVGLDHGAVVSGSNVPLLLDELQKKTGRAQRRGFFCLALAAALSWSLK